MADSRGAMYVGYILPYINIDIMQGVANRVHNIDIVVCKYVFHVRGSPLLC